MNDQGFFCGYGAVPGRAGCLAVLAVLLLVGCASKPPAAVSTGGATAAVGKDLYVVKKGDTLHSIAAAHGLDFRSLVIWNGIENPNHILVGQALRTRPPGSSSSASASVSSSASSASSASSEGTVVRPIDTPSAVEQRNLGGGGETLKREPQVGKEAYSEQTLARARAQVQQPAAAGAAPTPAAAAREESRPDATERADSNWIWPASGKVVGTFSEGGAKGIDISGKAGDPVLAVSGGKVVYSGTGLRGYGKLVIVKHDSTYLTAYAHNQSILVKEGQSVAKGQKIAEMGNTDADQVKLHFEVRQQGKPVDPLKHLPQR